MGKQDINHLKQRYNKTLKRHKDAEKFFDNPDISLERKLSVIDTYISEVTNVLGGILGEIEGLGVECTSEEIQNGFEVY